MTFLFLLVCKLSRISWICGSYRRAYAVVLVLTASQSSDTECEPCPPGTFSDSTSAVTCKPWTRYVTRVYFNLFCMFPICPCNSYQKRNVTIPVKVMKRFRNSATVGLCFRPESPLVLSGIFTHYNHPTSFLFPITQVSFNIRGRFSRYFDIRQNLWCVEICSRITTCWHKCGWSDQ